MAWEALAEVHVAHALQLITLLRGSLTLEASLSRYFEEMDLGGSMAAAVRTRALARIEAEQRAEAGTRTGGEVTDETQGGLVLEGERLSAGELHEAEGWRRFRPDVVVREVRERHRRSDEIDGWVQLSIARAEEAVMTTHVDNAITFAALLDEHLPLARAVQQYIDATGLAGGRAAAVFQRTMARLADVHLPPPSPTRS